MTTTTSIHPEPTRWSGIAPLLVATEHGPLAVPFTAVAAYHGHGALAMLALTYQGLRGALERLLPDGEPVQRNALEVLSGHSGPGVRDAFECVTRAVTRGRYRVDTSLPWARHNLRRDQSYSFVLSAHGRQVRAALREHVLPARFFELQACGAGPHREEFSRLRLQIADQVLAERPEALYDCQVEPLAG